MSRTRQHTPAFHSVAPGPVVNIAQKRSLRTALQPERKQHIFIAVPTISGNVHFTIAMLFGRAMASSLVKECPFVFTTHIEAGTRGIDYARNQIIKVFLKDSDADWLMMIDDDQVVPENFWELCAVTDADVVSGLTPVWVGNMDAEAMLRVNNYGVNGDSHCYNLPMPEEDVVQPYRVPVLGTGCIAIRRRVLAPKPAGVGTEPFYFTFREDRKVMGGEDINFSVECNRAGFILAVHPKVRFDHIKAMPLGQIDRYYRARKAMELEGRTTTEAQRLSTG